MNAAVSVTFTEHPDGRKRSHMRNTMSGWIEERDPEGFICVTLEDGFHFLIPGDEHMLNDRDFFIALAREKREIYWLRKVSP